MKIFLAGQHTYPGLIAELCGGGSGEVFIKQGAKAAMRLFMAGGVSGDLNPLWKESCRRMAEGQPFTNATEDAMKIFLAGGSHDISFTTNSSKSQKKNEMRIYLAGNGIFPAYIAPEIRRAGCNYTSQGSGPGGARGV